MSNYSELSTFNVIESIKKEYQGRDTIHLHIIGKKAGDMVAYIYGDGVTKGEHEKLR